MNEIDTQYEVLKMSQQDYKSSVTNRGESLKSDSSFDGVNNTNDGPMRGRYFRQVTNEEPVFLPIDQSEAKNKDGHK